MPNHITTILESHETVIGKLLRTVSREEFYQHHLEELKDFPHMDHKSIDDTYFEPRTIVDFENIIPSPKNKEKGGCNGSHENGVICWHSWNVENWGTKWGAYDMKLESPNKVRFDTAWSHPAPVIEVLSCMYPTERIAVVYADEDLGCNIGAYLIQNGQVQMAEIKEQSPEAYELAAQIKYGMSYEEVKKEWGEE